MSHILVNSGAVKCSEWEYDHVYMQYAFSPDSRFVFKWTFSSFLVVDTFYGTNRKFVYKYVQALRIRDFTPISESMGVLLYSQNRRTFISLIDFDLHSNEYEIVNPREIEDDCREYGGNITLNADDRSKGAAFLTRNSPGDIFVFFMVDKYEQIIFEQIIETEEREYCGFPYYAADTVYFFRVAYGGGQRPFEALKILERKDGASTQTYLFGPMPLMTRRDLMHRTQMPRFQGTWNEGIFYLSVNIDPDHYFTSLNLNTLKWTELIISALKFNDPRIDVNIDGILTVHDERKMSGSTNKQVDTYRIPLRSPETLQNLSFFQVSKNNKFKMPELGFKINLYNSSD